MVDVLSPVTTLRIVSFLFVVIGFTVKAQVFDSKIDLSSRADYRSEKSPRYQYRVRLYPQLMFQDNLWSLNGFAVTGDNFASSYNTFGADETHHFHIRRIYLRRENDHGKTEIGVIPTYKGRVSSTGLSKDGWITGVRQVYQRSRYTQIEWVFGELAHLGEPDFWEGGKSLNYAEFELSSRFNERTGFELGLEHMVSDNFARGEITHKLINEQLLSIELINRLDNHRSKLVLSLAGEFSLSNENIEYFAYYSHTSNGFGERAELTEDFVDYGHAVTLEIEGQFLPEWGLDWFSKLELNEGQQRFQLGLKFKL